MINRVVPAAVLLVLAGAARATEQLPIIVTYEMQRRHDAVRAERANPKAFWIREIVARIEEKTSGVALGLKQPATARVTFTVGRDGALASKAVATSSGVPAVDGAALALLDRAQPFPPMPAAMTEAALTFALPLRFR